MTLEKGFVRSIRGNHCEVMVSERMFRCKPRGRSKLESTAELHLIAVGDRVEIEPQGPDEGVIERILPRSNRLSRPDSHSRTREQVIVANVDALLVMHSVTEPDWQAITVDKCLVMGMSCRIPSVVVATKVDLKPAPDLEPYRSMGPVFSVSMKTREGVDALRAYLSGKTTVLLGPSGVGKSSLINVLDPEKRLKVGIVSDRTGEGRHTTTWAEILTVGDARLVDTPGLEFFDYWNFTVEQLPACFPEFDGSACRFRDCAHDREPGCRVRESVEAGRLSSSRYASYLEIRHVLQVKGPAFAPPRIRRRKKDRGDAPFNPSAYSE